MMCSVTWKRFLLTKIADRVDSLNLHFCGNYLLEYRYVKCEILNICPKDESIAELVDSLNI